MITYSNTEVYPHNDGVPTLADIGIGLGRQSRWGGQVEKFFPVCTYGGFHTSRPHNQRWKVSRLTTYMVGAIEYFVGLRLPPMRSVGSIRGRLTLTDMG